MKLAPGWETRALAFALSQYTDIIQMKLSKIVYFSISEYQHFVPKEKKQDFVI